MSAYDTLLYAFKIGWGCNKGNSVDSTVHDYKGMLCRHTQMASEFLLKLEPGLRQLDLESYFTACKAPSKKKKEIRNEDMMSTSMMVFS